LANDVALRATDRYSNLTGHFAISATAQYHSDDYHLMIRAYPKFNLLSCPLGLFSKQDLLELVIEQIGKRQVILAHQNLHGMALLQKSEDLQAFYRTADYCYIDGMPLVWLARLCGFPASGVHRNTQLDWFPNLLQKLSEGRSKVFFLGAPPQTTEKIVQYLKDTYPGLTVFAHHGFFTPSEADGVADLIREVDPDLLILGMGMPRQELWLLENRDRVAFGVAIPSGAILEYFVGAQKTPARRSGRLGLEWLVRLWNEPRRLSHRYLLEPWSLLIPAARNIWHYRVGRGRFEPRAFFEEVCRADTPQV
jgi:N-acetylglucosaminyldiphosphoundecaprenol N-acetyl-beta-D-mannosaminyltransferase